MESFSYYIVENSFAARVNQDTKKAERLVANGTWEPYADVWDVCTNGRWVKTEGDALDEAIEIFDLRGIDHQVSKG